MKNDNTRLIGLHNRLKDYNFDLIDSLNGGKILFENTRTPLLTLSDVMWTLPEGKQYEAYIDEPFKEVFRKHKKSEHFYKCGKENLLKEDCRTGYTIQYIISTLLPTLENELNLEEGELRLPTVEEYVKYEKTLYPFIRESEMSEWTSTLINERGYELYMIKHSTWKRLARCSEFSHQVVGLTNADGVCPGLGFRLVVDPSKKHQMKYTEGWDKYLGNEN